MSKEWKRVIAIMVFIGGMVFLIVLYALLQTKNDVERVEKIKTGQR